MRARARSGIPPRWSGGRGQSAARAQGRDSVLQVPFMECPTGSGAGGVTGEDHAAKEVAEVCEPIDTGGEDEAIPRKDARRLANRPLPLFHRAEVIERPEEEHDFD